MDFSLSSSLVGSAVSNPDKLALDLQFATDKTLTARKGPTPVFTRGSTATFVDSDGLVKAAPENLVLQSENFGTTWQTNNATITLNDVVAPDGSTTADRLNEDTTNSNHQVIQSIGSLIGGQPYTISVFAKAASHTTFQVATSTAALGSGLFANFILTGSGSVGNSNGVTTSIESYPNGWYRCSITINSVTGGTGGFVQIAAINNNSAFPRVPSYLGTNAQVVHLWGAQLERSSTVRTYNPTTTAAFYGSRFDHDPVTGVCKGLLMEESRTNICLQSENFGTTPWGGGGRSISLNAATAPDGSTTADKIVEGTNNGLHGVFQTLSTVSGSTYIGSMYIKAAGRDFATIYTGATPANGRFLSIPADGTGTVLGLFNANPSTVTMRYVGNGWYLVTILIVASATGTSLEMYPSLTATVNSYTGDGTSGILVWGAQLELGSFPTSYIPTTTASVIRSADVCSIIGSDFSGFYNQPEGTLFADVTPQTVAQVSNVLGVNTTTFSNGHIIYKIDSTFNAAGRRWGGQTHNATGGIQSTIVTSTDAAVSRSRLAYAYKLNDFAFAYAGGIVGTDTSGTVPTSTAMRIGSRDDGLSINGHLAAVRYYKKRLSNPKLQIITV